MLHIFLYGNEFRKLVKHEAIAIEPMGDKTVFEKIEIHLGPEVSTRVMLEAIKDAIDEKIKTEQDTSGGSALPG